METQGTPSEIDPRPLISMKTFQFHTASPDWVMLLLAEDKMLQRLRGTRAQILALTGKLQTLS